MQAKKASKNGDLTLDQFIGFFNEQHGYLSLDSTQVFIEPAVVAAAQKAAADLQWRSATIFAI